MIKTKEGYRIFRFYVFFMSIIFFICGLIFSFEGKILTGLICYILGNLWLATFFILDMGIVLNIRRD